MTSASNCYARLDSKRSAWRFTFKKTSVVDSNSNQRNGLEVTNVLVSASSQFMQLSVGALSFVQYFQKVLQASKTVSNLRRRVI